MKEKLIRGSGLLAIMLASTGAYSHHLSGQIYCDANRNEIIDTADTPLAGVRVVVENAAVGTFEGISASGSGDYYVDLPLGVYVTYSASLDVTTLPTDATFVSPMANSISFDIGLGQLSAEQNWLIDSVSCQGTTQTKGSIGDYVWDDQDQDGLQGSTEVGVSDVPVSLYECNAPLPGDPTNNVLVATMSTDNNGGYLFDNLDAGLYRVVFTPPSNAELTIMNQGGAINSAIDSDADTQTGSTSCFSLNQGEDNLTIDAGIVFPLASLGDYVWFDNDQDGAQGALEQGVDGLSVTLFDCGSDGMAGTADDGLLESTVTDAMGQYLFDDLMPGDYFVTFESLMGYVFTAQNQGTNDLVDSDANDSGLTACTTLSAGESDVSWDAGIFVPAQTCDLDVSISATPDVIKPNSTADCEHLGKPTELTFKYTGGGCAASDNAAQSSGKPPVCVGSVDDLQSVVVSAGRGENGDKGDYVVMPTFVSPGEQFTVSSDQFDSWSQFSISNSGTTESNTVHTSCSVPLRAGDVFGSITLIGFNGVENTGSDSTITYTVENLGDSLSDVVLDGSPFGHHFVIGSMATGDLHSFSVAESVLSATDLSAIASGNLIDGQVCSDSATSIIDVIGCEVSSESMLKISDDKIEWKLTNEGSDVISIENISIEWPDALGNLDKIQLSKKTIFDEPLAPASALISDWVGDLDERQIKAGDTRTLKIEFENKADTQQSDFKITINFTEGCSVTFSSDVVVGTFECAKPIDQLTMIWDGTTDVNVTAWKGSVGSTLLAENVPVSVGSELTVSGYAGSPNNVYWEIFEAGTSNKIGESVFHLSCSDSDMDGADDCGTPQGNGKDNGGSLINLWLLEGMVDSKGVFDCTL